MFVSSPVRFFFLFCSIKTIGCRSSHRSCSLRKGVLRNFAKFRGKQLCQSLFFNKVAGLDLWHRCFPVKFCEISKNTFFYRTCPVAVSEKLAFFEVSQVGLGGAIETPFLTCLIFIKFEANLTQSNFEYKFCKLYIQKF